MPDPDLNLLIALDALLNDASVAGAARRLGLSASAMSRTLARLREATGDLLLVRAGRRMVLTPCAEALRERTHQTVHDARALLRPSGLEPDLARLQRTFTIRANGGFVESFGAALIAATSSAAPLVRLRFAPKIEKTSAYLRDGSADLEIGVVGNMGPEVRVQALFRDHYVGVVRAGHPLASGPMTAERYAAALHVVASRRGRASGPVDMALALLGLERQVVAVVPGFPAALAIARASDLVALLPGSYLPAAQPDGCWVFALPVTVESLTISQMWHPRAEADPSHRWLRQLVLGVCRARIPRQHVPA
ncbi:LysR family transcriptional regulator [Massilia sp. S19_KUP03_FR1]|uniref:LysR family transcriptional regulator n=1 Tax=Massilia sp. S19_KUP03_FR1 TaxID=3025503 RepID=UPI002FCD9C84